MASAPPPAAASAASGWAPRAPAWWWLLLPVGPLALVAVDASLAEEARLLLLARLLYAAPALALLLALAVALAAVGVGGALRAVRRGWPALIGAAALVLVVVAVSPPALRVQFDESTLVAVSQGMHHERAALLATGAVPYDGGVLRLESTVDKRPPLFPFLVSLVHDLTGARIANAFAVNAVLLGGLLLLAFAALRPRLGTTAALAAPLLLLAVPLTGIVATSAGFDLLAGLLFAAVLLAALRFAAAPDGRRAAVLLALGGLFAQARYESLPALLVVLALVAWRTRGRFVPGRGVAALAVAEAWLAAPVVALWLHARQPNFYPEAGGQPLLALGHLGAHVPPFVGHWFAPALANPLPGVLALAAVPALVLRWGRRQAGFADLLVGVPVAAVTLLALAWFHGDVREPTALRLFLPLAWLSALLPLAALPARPADRRGASWLVLAAAAGLAAARLTELARGAAWPRLANAELATAMERAVDAAPVGAGSGRTLWLTVAAQHLIVRGHAALSPEAFGRRAAEVRQSVADGRIGAICVLTTPLDAAFAPAFGDPAAVLLAAAHEPLPLPAAAAPVSAFRLRLR
ncbi:MAG: glycosyltransferase family 39 protein [Planctomycetes bacterium]|nr:glycosyltransferase family 39 protein [Planctomycetota bacterium]